MVYNLRCLFCDISFQHRKQKKYCSQKHYLLHRSSKFPEHKIECKNCFKAFTVKYAFRTAKYCSMSCSNSGTKTKDKVKKICINCASQFSVNASRPEAKFCGNKCFNLSQRNGEEKFIQSSCEACDKIFDVKYTKRSKRFCSRRCAATGEMNAMFGLKGHLSPMYGKPAWNRGLTIETDERLRVAGEKISLVIANKIASGQFTHNSKSFKAGWIFSNKAKKDLYYRSSYELLFIKIVELDDNIKSLVSEPLVIGYSFEGKNRNYVPDFMIELSSGKKAIIEIKPKSMLKNEINKEKARSALKHCKTLGIDYCVFTEKELRNSVLDIVS